MSTESYQTATIINIDDTSQKVICQFNPNEYTFTKQNTWKESAGKGKEVPSFEFGGGKPTNLKMQLFFDTTSTGEDVRTKYTDKLWDMMRIKQKNSDTDKGEPPKCRFEWGNVWGFTAVITNISQKFTMFLANGTPIRAKVDITFQQIVDDSEHPFQNPTSRSEARRTRVIRAGDRLDLIAYEEYGDANRWHELAQANNLENPTDLAPGLVLRIVSL